MQIELTPDHVETITNEAKAAAWRLQRKLGLPACDREDLAQDLLIDLLRRLPAYDPARGNLGAFAGLILRNQSSRIAMRLRRERRDRGGPMLSLEAPVRDDGTRPLAETIAEDQGLGAWLGQSATAIEHTERRCTIDCALGQLADDDRRLCVALSTRSVAQLVTDGFGSRSALYRRLAELRHVLTAHGLGPSWDDFAAA
jgi:DNA-directed RNA polymerase specialized sigma24 family protein